VADLDPMDISMLANFAARRIDIDAVGHQLGGLETQKAFRRAPWPLDFSTRLWLTSREAGHPIPRFSDDDVLNFLVTEAIRVKVGEEMKRQRKQLENQQERESFRKSHKGMTVADLEAGR
jgi:hypothetical protein